MFPGTGVRSRLLPLLDVAMLEDTVADSVAVAVAGDAILQPGSPELHGAVNEHLLAHDPVLTAALVDEPGGDAGLSRARVHGLHLDLDVAQIEQLPAVPQATNAEIGLRAEIDADRELEMIQVNIVSLLTLTRAFLQEMIARKSGRILNVGSTAGFQPGPFMAAYYASKAFVNSFTEALWYELRGTGVTATVSCPGATATEFAAVAGNERSRLFRMGAASSQEVAKEGYRAMMAGKPMVVHGMKNKLAVQALRVSPRAAVRVIAASLNPAPARAPH